MNIKLFEKLSKEDINIIFSKYHFETLCYLKQTTIRHEGDVCNTIGIIIEGDIIIQTSNIHGDYTVLQTLSKNTIFGEMLLFADNNRFPANITALSHVTITFISYDLLNTLFLKYPQILQNFIKIISNRSMHLNDRIKLLTCGTIREKILSYIYQEYKKQNQNPIKLIMKQEALANYLNVQRPPLTNELNNLRKEGYISYNRNELKILNLQYIEDFN